MSMLYSKTGGFFHREIHDESQIPRDAVEISNELHQALINGQCEGKIITADKHGFPILVDQPAPTAEQLKERANAAIVRQIEELERDKQPRAMREYLIDGDKTRLEELNKQIKELRAQLQ